MIHYYEILTVYIYGKKMKATRLLQHINTTCLHIIVVWQLEGACVHIVTCPTFFFSIDVWSHVTCDHTCHMSHNMWSRVVKMCPAALWNDRNVSCGAVKSGKMCTTGLSRVAKCVP